MKPLLRSICLPALRERLKTASPNKRVRLLVQSGGDRREVVIRLRELM